MSSTCLLNLFAMPTIAMEFDDLVEKSATLDAKHEAKETAKAAAAAQVSVDLFGFAGFEKRGGHAGAKDDAKAVADDAIAAVHGLASHD
jgi:hypothetical protein